MRAGVGLWSYLEEDGKPLEGSEWRSDGVSLMFGQEHAVSRMDGGGQGLEQGGLLGGWCRLIQERDGSGWPGPGWR